MESLLTQFSGHWLYLALLIFLVLCGVGNPFPEDVALITGGYFTYIGELRLLPTVVVCLLGVLVGDALLYFFGRHYGQKLLAHRWLLRLIPPERIARIRHNFQRKGAGAIFFARFLVGLRSPTFLLAGAMHVRVRTFALYDTLGAVVSVPLFVGLGLMFGSNIEALRQDVRRYEHWVMMAGGALVVVWLLWNWFRMRREEKISTEQPLATRKTQ